MTLYLQEILNVILNFDHLKFGTSVNAVGFQLKIPVLVLNVAPSGKPVMLRVTA